MDFITQRKEDFSLLALIKIFGITLGVDPSLTKVLFDFCQFTECSSPDI